MRVVGHGEKRSDKLLSCKSMYTWGFPVSRALFCLKAVLVEDWPGSDDASRVTDIAIIQEVVEVPVCYCENGQFWNVASLTCSMCPENTYSDNINTISKLFEVSHSCRLKDRRRPTLNVYII